MQPQMDPAYAAWLASQQSQQAPVQQYAPPQQYAAPAAPAQPQYQPAPVQQNYAPPQTQAYPPAQAQFSAPPPPRTGSPISPRMQDLAGRLLLIAPSKVEYQVNSQFKNRDGSAQLQDRVTADVILLDGGPIEMGGSPDKGIPHTHVGGSPSEYLGKFISGALIITQLVPYLPENRPNAKYALGRLVRNPNPNLKPGQSLAWKLDDPTEADIQTATRFLADKALGHVQLVEPQPLAPMAPGPMAQAQQYQQAPQPQYAPQPQPPQYQPAPQPQQPAMDPAYAAFLANQQAQAQPPAQAAWSQGMPMSPPAPSAPPAPALDINTAPSGMDPQMWAAMPPETRAAILQSAAAPTPWR